MDDPVLVRHVQAGRHVPNEFGGGAEGQLSAACGTHAEEIALEVWHYDVVESRRRLAEPDDVADVRVGEFSAECGFPPQARHRGAVVHQLR